MEERQTANGGQMGLVEILLVEDDLNDVKLITHALQKYHLANRIYVVRDGAEALDYLFGTAPWLLLALLFIGIGNGFRNIIRISSKRS